MGMKKQQQQLIPPMFNIFPFQFSFFHTSVLAGFFVLLSTPTA